MAALEEAIIVKSLPVMPNRTSMIADVCLVYEGEYTINVVDSETGCGLLSLELQYGRASRS
jgi:hypothetical protein